MNLGKIRSTVRLTVVDVFRDLRIEPAKEHTWAVGQAVMREWVGVTGQQPDTELRQKTGGGGSHQIAVYPEAWRPRIEALIEKMAVVEPARQGALF